jgi:hypothetical protein
MIVLYRAEGAESRAEVPFEPRTLLVISHFVHKVPIYVQ